MGSARRVECSCRCRLLPARFGGRCRMKPACLSPASSSLRSVRLRLSMSRTERARFELRSLPPGPYLVRARLSGFIAPRGQVVQVLPSVNALSPIALRHVSSSSIVSPPLVPASVGPIASPEAPAQPEAAPAPATDGPESGIDGDELAWRLRHARRSILNDAQQVMVAATASSERVWSNARVRPCDGILCAPCDELLCGDAVLRPAEPADDKFIRRRPGRVRAASVCGAERRELHRGRAGWRERRLEGARRGNAGRSLVVGRLGRLRDASGCRPPQVRPRPGLQHPALRRRQLCGAARCHRRKPECRDVARLRHVHRVAGRHRHVRRRLRALRLPQRQQPVESPRRGHHHTGRTSAVQARLSRRATAPGAEEFVPPDTGIWLPPQRTFSSLDGQNPLTAERTTHVDAGVERDLGPTTISVRAL